MFMRNFEKKIDKLIKSNGTPLCKFEPPVQKSCIHPWARLVTVDVNWRFMSHIVDRKTENYEKLLVCKVPPESKKNEQFLFVFSI